jgi:GT2 family glycosyltransferase
MRDGHSAVTVGIVTRNRPDALRECLASLACLGDLLASVILIDDTSDVPIDGAWRDLPPVVLRKLLVMRQARREGPIVARNRIMQSAQTDFVLLMDDDAWLLDGASVRNGIALLAEEPHVGAVACAMANVDGSPWPASMQPAPVDYPCYVPAFIGFANLLRRDVFLRLGGYRESFHYYGEEKEYCLRQLDAGFDVVYTPSARVVHAPHPAGRSHSKYVRYVIRNDCLGALYNEPLPMPLVSVPVRLVRYLTMRRHANLHDLGGLLWIVGELVKLLPNVVRHRQPVRWATLRRWRQLRREWPAYRSAAKA